MKASRAASDYAAKRKAQLERAAQIKADRLSKQRAGAAPAMPAGPSDEEFARRRAMMARPDGPDYAPKSQLGGEMGPSGGHSRQPRRTARVSEDRPAWDFGIPEAGSEAPRAAPPAVNELDFYHQNYDRKSSSELQPRGTRKPPANGRRASEKHGAPTMSAARSHELNEAYMDEWDRGYAAVTGTDVTGPEPLPVRGIGSEYLKEQRISAPIRMLGALSGGNTAAWHQGPADPAGTVLDCSERPILCMSVHNDEAVLGGSDHALYVMNLNTGRRVRSLYSKRYGHSEWVTCVKHLADGRVISGGMDAKLCLWDAKGVKCVDLTGHSGSISVLKPSGDGRLAFSGSYDKTVRVWDTATARELCAFSGSHRGPVLDLAYAQDLVISGGRDGLAVLWDVASGTCSRKLRGHQGHVTAVASFGEGQSVFLSGAQDGQLKVWDSRAAGCVETLPLHVLNGKSGAVGAIETAGGVVVTAGADSRIQVLEPRMSWNPKHTFTEHSDFIYSLHVVPSGAMAFSGGGDGMLLAHDLESGKLLYGLGANEHAVRCIGSTPDRMVAAGDDGNAIVYQFE
eukprot:TRINITY_DN6915_c0_g1_i3.p1 TRINITY_DN6915_c0_g1~~TRINITY_DN6915_c0_g1_i3.p1  ORF type:complete len:568 (+),score=118.45 TRINITY_DN6915_c0_g1_i3:131-1834(+)